MTDQNQVELELIIVPQNITLRELKDLRVDLFTELERGLAGEKVELQQAPDSRALDPAVIGAIGVLLLPVVADKLGDILVEWAKRRNECNITVKIPVRGNEPLEIAYDPRHVTDAKLKEWIDSAVRVAESNTP